jgi:hypothetical protein|tara:strand:- start:1778 stop:2323 length:546 start_codon:yes stop_codon:yes gene_type:complete
MGFINNHKDNFLPTSHPWGDDNISTYSMPKSNRVQNNGPVRSRSRSRSKDINPSDLGYEQLSDMISQITLALKTLPNGEGKLRLRERLMSLRDEKSKRDELEVVASEDRDDNFDVKDVIVKEDVVEEKPPTSLEDTINLDEFFDDLEEDEVEEPQPSNKPDINNFLIAALIIITFISVTKK